MRDIIFLLGFMGCGKTTLGRALAERADVRFVDLDDYVEARAGMSISRIFELRGERAFRAMEREALTAIATEAGPEVTVVACGGGTPCAEGNMELMNSLGRTVFLQTSPDRLMERLLVARSHRPLIAAMNDDELAAFVAARLPDRVKHYSKAAHTFDSTLLDDKEQVELTSRLFIDRFLNHR